MVLPASVFAIQKPRPEDRVLPNFDTRFRGPRASTVPPGVERALEGLRRQSSLTLDARFHPLTRALRVLAAREGPLTPPSDGAPEEIARGFVRAHRELFGLSEADVSSLVRAREYESHGERIRHVLLQQVIDGIPVFGGVVGVHLDEAGRVVFVSNNGVPAQDARTGAAGSAAGARLGAEDAIRAAVANVRPELAIEPQVVAPPSGPDQRATFARGPLKRAVPARLVYFPARPRPRLAWRVLVEPAGFPQAYDILVDAQTGEILYRRNRVNYADGVASVVQSDATALRDARLLDEHPGGSGTASAADPATGCPPLSGYASRSLTAPFRDPGTVLFGTGRLAGNNARAYRGSVGAFGALGATDPGGAWHFEFPFNTAESAEAHLFFAANFLHDFFYDLGFDEAAGNFQVDNFGRGGLGGDPLNALARADGRNNATFEPQPEGVSPTMSMFLFDGAGCWSQDVDGDGAPDLDGDYDSDIFIHEYHHGVSHRLNTDFTGDEADAMGEGGSDFFAYSINGNTKLAEYVAPPDGIRQVNAKTYADWACYDFFFFFICEPHDNGEIWANTLWDMREQFRADLVKGSEATAINEVHQLYVDGLKLSPASPTMLDMRDAMLQADQNRNPSADLGGSENYCRMWLAFAGRGLGIHARDTHDTGDATVVADTSLPAICPAPPPKPTVTVTATDPTAAEAGLDPAAFTFTRNGSTDAALVVHYTVSGSATPGSDYVALSGTVTIPAGAADATVIVTPLDDPLVESDETVEVDLAANSAYVIGAPASAVARIVSDDVAPDLVVGLTVPYIVAPGVPVTVADTTSNQGTGPSTTSLTRFYLSRDGSIDAADIVLGTRTVPALAVGATSNGSTSVTIPAGTAAGEYVVIAEADSGRTNDEIVETNNTAYAYVRIGPDLIITAVSSFTSGVGEAVTLSDTTYNVGAGDASASVTKYYLSANPVVDAGDTLLGSRAVPALASHAASSGSATVTIPATVTAGVYNLIAQADGDGTVPETQEGNNTSYSIVYVGPDLAITAVTASATGGAGAAVTVSDTTKNQGGGGAAASVTRFYLSANNVLDAADTPLGSRPVPALPVGATSVGSTTVTIPAVATGNYFLLVKADGDGTVPEVDELNNLNWTAIQIGPDLTITALTAPTTAGSGMPVTVGDTTRNQGGGGAAASITKFYLSTNPTLDAGDALLGSRAVPALAAGATSAASTTVMIPAGTGPGTYYLIAQADGDGAVTETSETNNVSTAVFQVGPDLVVSALTAPPSSGADAAIVVNDTTINQGAGPAAASVTRFYLSANAVLDLSDRLLGSRAVSALGATASSSGSTTVTIPPGTAAGSYYLIAQADGEESIPEVQEGNNTAAVAIQIGPDLIVTAFTAPAASGTGSSFTVSETTRNQAGGSAAASVTKFFLSTDAILDAADTLVGSRSVPALGPGASSAASTTLTIPAGTGAGLYYLIAQADGDGTVGELSETNNTSFVSIQVGPDLMIASLLGPAAAGAGAAISVSDTTRNQGGGSAAASVTRIYLSTNTLLDAGDTPLGGRAVPTLAAGASSAGSTTVTIPPATLPGTYFLIAQADGDATVPETAESNNIAVAAIQIGPDLIVLSLTAPPSGGAGGSITVNDTTRNQASAPAPASATRFYLSADGVLDASDVLLGSRAVPALAGATSSSGSTALTIPTGTASGPYYVIAQADGDQVVPETQEANNTALVFMWVGPDLTVATVTAPATADAGATISVSDTTRNQGGGSAAASVTRIYLSTNTVVDAGDTPLGGRTVPALAAGASSAGSTTVTIPAATLPGSYYLVAQADADGTVPEISESNNTAAAAIQIGPDLIVLALTAPPSGGAGGSITVNDTTRNQASSPAPASSTRFYLSANAVLDAPDVLLGSRAVPALAGATSNSGSTVVIIPAGTPAGGYYVIAQADGDQVVPETQEANNTAVVFMWIGPDLTVAAVTAPPTAGAGAAISVTDTTRNLGGGAAPASVTRVYLSVDGALDASDALLGSRDVGPLAVGASSTGTTTVTIPASTATGSYYLLVQADGGGAVAEMLETNNVTQAYVQVGPDLTIVSAVAPAAAGAGGTFTVSDTTKNQGGGTAGASVTRFYLSTNGLLDAGDMLLGSRAVGPLGAGETSAGSTVVTIPAGTGPGTYYLITQADGEGVIAETQEGNNTSWRAIAIGPDLVVSTLSVPAGAGAGVDITVNDTTRNAGGAPTPATTTSFYLSTNYVLDAADPFLGSRAVPPLGSGENSPGSTLLTIPGSTAPGGYYILAQADAGGVVAETAESNNTAYAYVQIGPDLTMTIAAPYSAAAGSAITITDTVRNQGGGAAAATTSRFYLSANPYVDGGDAVLGVRATPAIAAGGQDSGSSVFTIPAGTAAGTYYILTLADADNAVPEIVETNNLGWWVLRVTP